MAGLFKQYYDTALAATSYEGLQQAAKFFSSAVIGGLLDLLGLLAGGSALARIRLLRAQGRLTVAAWLEAMSEWSQQLSSGTTKPSLNCKRWNTSLPSNLSIKSATSSTRSRASAALLPAATDRLKGCTVT